jgi:hypothetical protein
MNEADLKDTGTAMALLERFRTQRLPRALKLKEKVDQGERLEDTDLAFLKEVLESADEIKGLVDRHPEYQEIYSRSVDLYHAITSKALANETSGKPGT